MKKRLKIKQLLLGIGLSILGLLTFSNSKINAASLNYSDNTPTGFTYNEGLNYPRRLSGELMNNDYINITSDNNGKFSVIRMTEGDTYLNSNCSLTRTGTYIGFSCSYRARFTKAGAYYTTQEYYIDIYKNSGTMVITDSNATANSFTYVNTPIGGGSDITEEDIEEAYNQGYNAGISSTEGYQNGYQAGIIAGREEGYQNGYDTGYQEGYDEGYVTNNTIPNIYIQSSNLIYNTGYFPLQISITDYINNLNGKLDFTALYNYDFAGAPNQNMIGELVLNTEIPVSDTLKFDLVNNDTLSNNLWVILGNTNNSCNNNDYGINCVYLTYSDLVNNNYMITANTLYPNLNITEFNYIQLSFNYNNNMMYGVKSITDITMTSTADSEYDIGYNVGYIVGKNEGMLLGRTEAYNLGYEAGLDYQFTNENTITGMMGTLFTMPINMFKTIFDFEFLGVNLAGFFLSLVTLLVVIWLIKKFI